MNQDKLNELIELEEKFKRLAEIGHPNVIDNGFFIDAVFNVTGELKKQHKDGVATATYSDAVFEEKLQVIDNLYQSLKAFEGLYTNCLGNVNQR